MDRVDEVEHCDGSGGYGPRHREADVEFVARRTEAWLLDVDPVVRLERRDFQRSLLSRRRRPLGIFLEASDLVDLVSREAVGHSALVRDELVKCWSHGQILKLMRMRLIANALAGREPGAEASVRKALADDHGQEVMMLAHRLAASAGMLRGRGPGGVAGDEGSSWYYGFLYSQALTIGGGTSVVQRNIIAERVLGLPKDVE